jgi:hypothetical protein
MALLAEYPWNCLRDIRRIPWRPGDRVGIRYIMGESAQYGTAALGALPSGVAPAVGAHRA